MRYGKANIEADVAMGVIAGVAGFDGTGVTGRAESVAERAGDGGIIMPWEPDVFATLGVGATMGGTREVGVGSRADEDELALSGL